MKQEILLLRLVLLGFMTNILKQKVGIYMINKRKIISLMIISMLLTMIPATAFASDSITLAPIDDVKPGSNITISGNTSLSGATVKILRPNKTIFYINTIEKDFNKIITIPTDAQEGTYTVVAGKGTDVAKETFKVTKETSKNADDEKPDNKNKTGGSSGGGGGGGSSTSNINAIKSSAGGSVEKYGATVKIPKDAFDFDNKTEVKIEKISDTAKLSIPKNKKLASNVVEVTKDKKGDFKKAVTITLEYDKNKFDTDKYDLAIYWLDEEKEEWNKLDNISVDKEKGIVKGEVKHFTKFAVLAIEKETVQQEPNGSEKPEQPENPTVTLTDIKGHWAEEFITNLVNLNAIKGYPDNTFKPNNNITRAEFATVLVKGFKLEQKGSKVFADTTNHWAKDFIATAAANGIVSGYDENTFGPNDLITREQMAVMIAKALKIDVEDSNITFADKEKVSSWAKNAVAASAEKGIIKGYPDNTFKPLGKATRAEAVTVIMKALQ